MRETTVEERVEMVNLYHLARTALSGQDDGRYQRMLWAHREFMKTHEDVKSKSAWLDLGEALA